MRSIRLLHVTQILVRPSEYEHDVQEAPRAKLRLISGQLEAVDPQLPLPLPLPPAGWYADHLRFWDAQHWTSLVRTVPCPSSQTHVDTEDELPVRALLPVPALLAEPDPVAEPDAVIVGLLGLPPPLVTDFIAPSVDEAIRGQLGLPPPLVVARRTRTRRWIKAMKSARRPRRRLAVSIAVS